MRADGVRPGFTLGARSLGGQAQGRGQEGNRKAECGPALARSHLQPTRRWGQGHKQEVVRALWVLPPCQGAHGKNEMGSSPGDDTLLSWGCTAQSAFTVKVGHIMDLGEKNHTSLVLGFGNASQSNSGAPQHKPYLPRLNELIQLGRVLVVHTFKWKNK